MTIFREAGHMQPVWRGGAVSRQRWRPSDTGRNIALAGLCLLAMGLVFALFVAMGI